jgi:hypothetical protein
MLLTGVVCPLVTAAVHRTLLFVELHLLVLLIGAVVARHQLWAVEVVAGAIAVCFEALGTDEAGIIAIRAAH